MWIVALKELNKNAPCVRAYRPLRNCCPHSAANSSAPMPSTGLIFWHILSFALNVQKIMFMSPIKPWLINYYISLAFLISDFIMFTVVVGQNVNSTFLHRRNLLTVLTGTLHYRAIVTNNTWPHKHIYVTILLLCK